MENCKFWNSLIQWINDEFPENGSIMLRSQSNEMHSISMVNTIRPLPSELVSMVRTIEDMISNISSITNDRIVLNFEEWQVIAN